MKPHNLILLVLLITSTSLVAQKRAQRPRPVKQAAQNVENLNNNLPFDVVPITINNRDTISCRSSRLLTTTNNNQKDQCPVLSNGQFDRQEALLMMDRFTNSEFDDSKNNYRLEGEFSQDEIINPVVEDRPKATLSTTSEKN